MIPLVDLKAQTASIREQVEKAIAKVIDETAFVLGKAVAEFEQAFASYIGVKHCVGVNSGTAALQLALMAAGIGPGDEVVTTPSTFFATAEAISLAGARPVFVDAEISTLNIDASKIESAITPRTRAVVPVHLYGQSSDMSAIVEIARRRNLLVIEDACQAHGATFGDRRCGGIGLAGAFSFYPGKNLGAWGEGGAVTTDDDAVAVTVRQLRDHGSLEKYRHTRVGYNYRLEGIQGAVLGVKLKHLDSWNRARVQLAARYRRLVQGIGDVTCIADLGRGQHANHLFVVRSRERDRIFKVFAERGVAQAIHYPIPVHLQPAYASLGYGPGSFPVAEAAAEEIFSLPLYPELTQDQQDTVVDALRGAFL
jgi:dTDP-4-amino-4,6-dideoxygalactose transaminase